MNAFVVSVIPVVLLGTSGHLAAQQRPAHSPSSTYISAADLRAVLETVQNRPVADMNARTVPSGMNDVLVNIARRTEAGMTVDGGIAHGNLTEVYYVIEGAGVLVTGGTLRDFEEVSSSTGINVRGKGIEGGETRRISVGDVVVIPAGTPHAFRAIEGTIVYLNIRIDPGKR